MEEEKENLNKPMQEKMNWKPFIIFYVKTTSWIIFPLLLGLLLAKYIRNTYGSQTLFLACLMLGFGITCFGIYREIKNYKKDLDGK